MELTVNNRQTFLLIAAVSSHCVEKWSPVESGLTIRLLARNPRSLVYSGDIVIGCWSFLFDHLEEYGEVMVIASPATSH